MSSFGLAQALMELGHDNLVLTTDANGAERLPVTNSQLTYYQQVPVIYTRRWGHNSYFYSPELAGLIGQLARKFDIALVNGNWVSVNLLARKLLPNLDLPYIVYPRGILDTWAMGQKRWKKLPYWYLIEKYNYLRAAGAVALTQVEYRQIKKYVPQVTVEVIPNGINLEDFYPAPGYDEFAQRFPGLSDRPFILFLSRLDFKKGMDILFPALASFLGSNDKLNYLPRLVVAGAGDRAVEGTLRAQVKKLGLGAEVVFTGLVTGFDKLCLLHHCIFFVLPSRSEGLPVAVLEALACARPVIITQNCNLPEVPEAKAGIMVDLNPSALAEAMGKMWARSEDRLVMGERALKLIQEKFTRQVVAEKTVHFCQQILQKRKHVNSNQR